MKKHKSWQKLWLITLFYGAVEPKGENSLTEHILNCIGVFILVLDEIHMNTTVHMYISGPWDPYLLVKHHMHSMWLDVSSVFPQENQYVLDGGIVRQTPQSHAVPHTCHCCRWGHECGGWHNRQDGGWGHGNQWGRWVSVQYLTHKCWSYMTGNAHHQKDFCQFIAPGVEMMDELCSTCRYWYCLPPRKHTFCVSVSLNALIYGDNLPILCWFYICWNFTRSGLWIHASQTITLGLALKNNYDFFLGFFLCFFIFDCSM